MLTDIYLRSDHCRPLTCRWDQVKTMPHILQNGKRPVEAFAAMSCGVTGASRLMLAGTPGGSTGLVYTPNRQTPPGQHCPNVIADEQRNNGATAGERDVGEQRVPLERVHHGDHAVVATHPQVVALGHVVGQYDPGVSQNTIRPTHFG